MPSEQRSRDRLKYMFSISAVLVFLTSTGVRLFNDKEVDEQVCYLFTACFAIVFGANAVEFFKK